MLNLKKMFGGTFGDVSGKYGLRMTFQGIGVAKGDGKILVLDKETKKITSIPEDLTLGELPVYAVPAIDLAVGDTIIHDGKVKVVTDLDDSGIIAINIGNQTEEVILVAKNLFGFSEVSKVISLIDPTAFGGSDGKKVDPLLLLALGGGLGDGDNMMETLLMASAFGGGGLGNLGNGLGDLTKNPLLLMLLMKD